MAKNYSATSPMTLTDRILYAVLYGFVFLLSLLPFWLLYMLSDGLFLIIYHVVGYRKRIVRDNLKSSFPEKSKEELLAIERKFYHFFCDYIFETIKLFSMSKKKIQRHIQFRGLENVNKVLGEGHNAAIYLAHYCNWEWVTSFALFFPPEILVGQVYHVLENKAVDTLMLKLRSRMGAVNIPRFELLRRVVKERRQGRQMVVGFISDQGPEMHTIHYWTHFLNHETAVITGTETIAKKCDFSCLYMDITRVKRGYYVVDIVPLANKSSDYEDFEITELYVRALEKTIIRQPENWLWTHNRWKRTRQQYEEYLSNHPQLKK